MTTSKLVEYLRAVSKTVDPSMAALLEAAADRLIEQSAVLVEIANSGVGMDGNDPCTACTHNVLICEKAMNITVHSLEWAQMVRN